MIYAQAVASALILAPAISPAWIYFKWYCLHMASVMLIKPSTGGKVTGSGVITELHTSHGIGMTLSQYGLYGKSKSLDYLFPDGVY